MCNLWIACRECQSWHLKVTPCVSQKLLPAIKQVNLVWTYQDIWFVDEDVTEIYELKLICPYLHKGILNHKVAIDIAYNEFKRFNKRALEYTKK